MKRFFITLAYLLLLASCQLPSPIATITATVDLNDMGSQSSQLTVNFTDFFVSTANNQTVINFTSPEGDSLVFTFAGTSLSGNSYDIDQNNFVTGSFVITANLSSQEIQVEAKSQGYVNVSQFSESDGSYSGSGDFHVNFDGSGGSTGSGFGSFSF
ncbi:MAG: hypothetical protein KDD52_06880 [Bdellovibrionales bacterium]|nr:hypothetical protein [Bdellovibrionales bacterium]